MHGAIVGAAVAMLLTSCAPAVQLFDCVDDGVDEALAEACVRDEVNCEVATRLDIFCRPDIDTFSRCGRSPAEDIEACTVQLGTSPIPGYRARVYALEGVSVAAAIDHESRHWPLWDDLDTNACQTHEASCGWIED